VLHAVSGNMPEWVGSPVEYWNAADIYERANGRLYKELQFALPIELNPDQRIELAENFARAVTEEQNLPYSLAVHAGKGENPHCHLMISERVNDGDSRNREQWFKRFNGKEPAKGGAKKTDKLKPKEWLIQTREQWANMANQVLEKYGHEERIDHRSNDERGLLKKPISVSRAAYALEQKGIRTDAFDVIHKIDQDNKRLEELQNGLNGRHEKITGPGRDGEGIRATGDRDRGAGRSVSGGAGQDQQEPASPGEGQGDAVSSDGVERGSQESGTDQDMANSPAGVRGGNRGGSGSTNRIVNLARLVSRRTRGKSHDEKRKPAVEKLHDKTSGASRGDQKRDSGRTERKADSRGSKPVKRRRGQSRDDSGWER